MIKPHNFICQLVHCLIYSVYLAPYICNVCIVDMLTSAVTHWSRTSADSIGTPGTRLHFYRLSSNHRVIKLLQISSCVTSNCAKNRLALRVRWPIGHACAHTLWPFSYPCHTRHKAVLLLLLEQPEGYNVAWLYLEDTDATLLRICFILLLFHNTYFGRTFQVNCSWISRWLVFQTRVSSRIEKYFDSSR